MSEARSKSELLRQLHAFPTGSLDKMIEVHPLHQHVDGRGILVALELSGLPFLVQRIFFVTDVDTGVIRGCHGHKNCWQAWLCLAGEVTIEGTDGMHRFAHKLMEQTEILIMHPGVWALQHSFSADAVILVLASHPYDEQDYYLEMDGGS